MPRKRAAVYARLSRKPEEDGNIRQQVERGLEVIKRAGWRHVETYVDDGRSAWREDAKRSDFARLLKAARAGEVDVIVVRKLDRLTRNQGDWGDLSRTSVQVADWSGRPLDSFAAAIEVAVAVRESDNASFRGRLGEERRVERGKPPRSGRRHFGYHQPRANGKPCCGDAGACTSHAVRDDEAGVIRDVAKRWLRGETMSAIARDLNERRVLTPAGNEWNHTRLKRTIQSPRLAAIRTHNGTEVKGAWEPVLSLDLHHKLRAADGRAKNRRLPEAYLLRSLVECGTCGASRMWGKRIGDRLRRYVCHACGAGIASGPVDELVWTAALGRTWYRDRESEADARRRLNEVEAERGGAQSALDELDDAYWQRRELPKRSYDRQAAALRERVERAGAEAKRIRRDIAASAGVWTSLQRLTKHGRDATPDERRAVIEDAVSRVIIEPVGAPSKRYPRDRDGWPLVVPHHPNVQLHRVGIEWKDDQPRPKRPKVADLAADAPSDVFAMERRLRAKTRPQTAPKRRRARSTAARTSGR